MRLALSCYFIGAVAVLGQTSVAISPQQVTLAAPAGSTTPAVQTLTLVASGGNFPFSASVRYLGTTIDWLTVAPTTGTTPAVLTVTANVSKLTSGTYLGQVVVNVGQIGTYANVLFTVGSTGSGSGGQLVADPTGLTFFAPVGAGVLPAKSLSITARGTSSSVGFNASATSSGNWLTVSPSSGLTPATLDVVVTPAGLSKGTYTGAITINAAGSSPRVVPVTLVASGTDSGSVTPALKLTQTALMINYQTSTPPPPVQTIGVTAVNTSAISFTAETTASWLRLTSLFNPAPVSSLTEFLPGEFSVVIDPTGLAVGTHTGTITVSAGGASQQLTVTLTIGNTAALNASPSSVSLDDTTREAPVTVTATGSASLAFTASSNASWLNVSPTSGSTASGSQVLTLRADPSLLTAGTYNGVVTLTAAATGATVSIPVQFTTTGIGSPASITLQISPESVDLSGVIGLPNPVQLLNMDTSVPGATQDFTTAASSTEGWLAVEPFSGTAPAKLTVSANPAAVSGAGTYNGSVMVTSLVTGAVITVPVRFTLAAQGILADPASLTFTQAQKGVSPPPQTITISSNVPSAFTITPIANWIQSNLTRGSTRSTATISVNPAGLPPGITTGAIRIDGPNNTLTIPVSLAVPEPPAPTVTPAALTFTYELGSPPPSPQPINIGSTGDAVNFTATAATDSGIDWLAINPKSGTTPSIVSASVRTGQLVPGRQLGTITVASPDGSIRRTVAVTLNVTASGIGILEILNGAALFPTPVSPGQVVTVTGVGLGPSTGISARPTAAGAIETRLADVRLLFDGVPAPLLSVRADQISAIVPYAIYGRFNTRVQVESGMSFSIPIDVKVVDSAPGIFTISGTGRGQAAALNADLTTNSAANPAPRGSVITVFGTGEGQTDPPGQDGRIIATDLRRPLLPVAATIAGRTAQVTYSGSAAMQVSGIFQANIRIPEDIGPGIVPIEIRIGSAASQAGVTIAVR